MDKNVQMGKRAHIHNVFFVGLFGLCIIVELVLKTPIEKFFTQIFGNFLTQILTEQKEEEINHVKMISWKDNVILQMLSYAVKTQ